ncbi:MAG: anhydro-N-acetylmuramic acid kinase, partial [Bacteroidales bacterium]
LMELHRDFGRFTGESVNRFLENTDKKVDFIAAHGHTVFHQPEQGLTLQIGDGAEIAAVTGISSVSDFRRLDVALGGQGAPLVPAGDELLFGNYNYCLNLGGFANISFRESGQRLAFDVCPVNIVINRLAQNIGQSFDKDGKIAEKGKLNPGLLKTLENLDFYKLTGPRSLGKEWVDEVFIPPLDESGCNTADKLRTVYEHIARRIAAVILKPSIHGQVIDESFPGKTYSATENRSSRTDMAKNKNIYREQEEFIETGHGHPGSLLITGGGAKNGFLTKLISEKTAPVYMVIPEEELVNFKEAVVFAFLGLLRMRNEANCLSSVTGARHNNSGGIIHNA